MLAFASLPRLVAAVAACCAFVAAQNDLACTEPSSSRWWVSGSDNTLRWTGTTPKEFSVFISNPDVNVLTSKLALISVQQLYEYSKTVVPSGLKVGSGYVIELTNTLNSSPYQSEIYATSQPFEIKAAGSTYPPQTSAAGSSASGSASGSNSASSASASAASSKPSSAAVASIQAGLGGVSAAVMLVGGLVSGMMA